MKEVFIVSAKRTPIGGFLGQLSNFSATQLGAIAIQETCTAAGISPEFIDSVYMGNVLSANLGQSPARQAAKFAGISDSSDCTTINKVCSSGMKATMIGAQPIQLGLEDLVMTGGMESMSNVPHYSLNRKPIKLGDGFLIDGLLKDGLTDVYHQCHMGQAAEKCVSKFGLTRQQQDDYALRSYQLAAEANQKGNFSNEMIPISLVRIKEETLMVNDEDISKIIPEKIPFLKPIFDTNGTITAANASNLNDGAAAILLASKEAIVKYQLKPLAKIVAYADTAQAPEWFTTSPSLAIQKVLYLAHLTLQEMDYIEINEAYAAVALANQQILNIDQKKLNVFGGAIALGHPLGASGARIICTLLSILKNRGGKFGVAAICNGGGGASAIIIENLN